MRRSKGVNRYAAKTRSEAGATPWFPHPCGPNPCGLRGSLPPLLTRASHRRSWPREAREQPILSNILHYIVHDRREQNPWQS